MEYILSIITICKDDINGIKSTIDSTRQFRNTGFVQYIIIDSSSETIKEEIQSYIKNDTTIEYYYTSPKGISDGFNQGLKHVKGHWVWFLNAGDNFKSDISERSILETLKYTSADVLFYKVRYVPSNIISEFPPIWLLWPNTTLWAPHPSAFVRFHIFVNEGCFSESLKIAMDYELWNRVFNKKYVINLVSIPIVDFDETGISITNKKKAKIEVQKVKLSFMFSFIKTVFKKCILLFKSF
jgi:glycosyltransferase involved in cell wall biosynthesis